MRLVEDLGCRFHLEGERLLVEVTENVLTPHILGRLRATKSELRAEIRLLKFVELLRPYAAIRLVVLSSTLILYGLEDANRDELARSDLAERQAWAGFLADRPSGKDNDG